MNDFNQIYLLIASFFLGLRHGVEWDHLAAIIDITASDVGFSLAGTGIITGGYHISRAFWLSTCYGLGHSLVVIALGLAARSFAALFPQWFDSACERVVGTSLIIFAFWVFMTIIQSAAQNEEPKPTSRWMLAYSGWKKIWQFLKTNGKEQKNVDANQSQPISIQITGLISFLIGMLHGLGVETGTQIIILSALGASASTSFGFSCAFLFVFIIGLITANSIVALCSAFGLTQTRFFKPLYLSSGLLAGAFSLVIGAYLVCGHEGLLPKLNLPALRLPMVSMLPN